MPMHIQPLIRAREEAEESNGLIQTMDSVGLTRWKAVETAGNRSKVVPKCTFIFRGTVYTPS